MNTDKKQLIKETFMSMDGRKDADARQHLFDMLGKKVVKKAWAATKEKLATMRQHQPRTQGETLKRGAPAIRQTSVEKRVRPPQHIVPQCDPDLRESRQAKPDDLPTDISRCVNTSMVPSFRGGS
jgi:hypothetical protein